MDFALMEIEKETRREEMRENFLSEVETPQHLKSLMFLILLQVLYYISFVASVTIIYLFVCLFE